MLAIYDCNIVGLLKKWKGVKIKWPTITAVAAFFAVADRSDYGYVSTSSNR